MRQRRCQRWGGLQGLRVVAQYPVALGRWGGQGTGDYFMGGTLPSAPPSPRAAAVPWAGAAFVLEPPPAEPSPPLPSGRPRGCSVPLKGLQAWLWDRHPIPAGHGTGQSRTALDSRRQPCWHTVDRSLHRYRTRAGAGGRFGGHKGWGTCWSCPRRCPWTRLLGSESWGTADAWGHL